MGLRDKDDDFGEPPCQVRVIETGDGVRIRLEGLRGWPTWDRRYTREEFLRALERCLNEGSL